jgi:hypothetical protein
MYKYWKKILDLHNISFAKKYFSNLIQMNENQFSHLPHPNAIYDGGKIVHNYKGKEIIFFKTVDEYNTIYSIKELNNDEEMDCVLILIEKNLNHAVINNISNYKTCIGKNKNFLSGSNLLDISIDFIKSLKPRYNLKKILLTDNSNKPCVSGKKIKLSKLYILTHGHTWYGSRGFVPYDKRADNFNYNKDLINKYEKNLYLFKNIKIKDVSKKFISYLDNYKLITKQKDKFLDFYKDIIKVIRNNPDLLFGYLLKYFLRNYDFTCAIFETFYEKLFTDLGYSDFYNVSFYLKI